MKNIKRVIALVLVASSLAVLTANAEPSLNDLKDDKKKAEQEIKELEAQLTSTIQQINKTEQELVDVGAQIIQAGIDLEESEALEQVQHEAMKQRIVAMYENGNTSMITTILEAENIADMLKQAENVQAIHAYDRKQLEEYIKTKEKIEKLKTALESDMEYLEAKQERFDEDKRALNGKIAELEEKVDDFDERIERIQAQAYRPSGPSNNGGGSTYVPPVGTGGGAAIVAEAYKYLGVPYVWGGQSASGADCSGLVLLAHRAIGVNLPHYSGSQGAGGAYVSPSNRQPGDVVCYNGHVGIYIGGGQMIHAPQPGEYIEIVAVYGNPWYRRYW